MAVAWKVGRSKLDIWREWSHVKVLGGRCFFTPSVWRAVRQLGMVGVVVGINLGVGKAEDGLSLGKNLGECDIANSLGVMKPGCPPLEPRVNLPVPRQMVTPAPDSVTVASPSPPPPPPPPQPAPLFTASFQIAFEFGSARLSTEACKMLDQIGQVLSAPEAAGVRFRITGHTDRIGAATTNQRLSEQRAQAVRDYLVTHFSIVPTRLETRGRGARDLLDPAHPAAAVNRRVEITNLGGV